MFFFNETKWQPLSKRSCKASHWLSSLLALDSFESKGLCLFCDSEIQSAGANNQPLIPGPRPGYIATSNWFSMSKKSPQKKTAYIPEKIWQFLISKLVYKGEGTFSHPTKRMVWSLKPSGMIGVAEKPLCQTPPHAIPFHRAGFLCKSGQNDGFFGRVFGRTTWTLSS